MEKIGYADEHTYQFYKGDIDLVHKLLFHNYSTMVSKNSFIEHFCFANIKIRRKNFHFEGDDGVRLINKWRSIFKQIEMYPFEQKIHHEISYDDKLYTVNYWKNVKEYKVFVVKEFLKTHLPRNIKKILTKLFDFYNNIL